MKAEKESSKSSSTRAWEALTPPLAEWVLDAMASMGFGRMTPVQASTIPLFMTHKDVVVEAVTGSGKTLAFLIPTIERLLRLDSPTKKHHVGAIVISPTRELASQIHNVALSLLAFHGPSAAALKPPEEAADPPDGVNTTPNHVYPRSTPKVVPQLLVGGAITPAQDLTNFLSRSPNLLISTPGRLLELLSSPHVHCPQSSFEVLVLDEADRLLDLGFKEDLQKILGKLPKQRRTGLFSASVSEAVDQLIRVGLRNPVKISVRVKGEAGGEQRTPARLQMSYLLTSPTQKLPALSLLLQSLSPTPLKTIVYMSTCAAVDYYQHILPTILNGKENLSQFALIPLHGKHPPQIRTKNFTAFSDATTPTLLLTTDVAARGLDIPLVDLVIQLDPPSDPKVFLHRCGRAGRAGRKGLSVVFLTPGKEEDYVQYLSVRKTPITPLLEPRVVTSEENGRDMTDKIRSIVMKDRALHDKAQKAFVSWVRAYSKHQASSIFRVQDTDWKEVGCAWGLLRMPKMPEAKKWDGDRNLGLSMEWKDYAYKDKKREEVRKAALLKQREGLEEKVATNGSHLGRDAHANKKRAWSDKIEAKDERQARREKKHARRDKQAWAKMSPEERATRETAEALAAEVRKMNEEARKFEEWEGIDS